MKLGSNIEVLANGCWAWRGKIDDYGRVSTSGGVMQAHRAVYEAFVGPIPDGAHVHHRCERPGCVNPEHLEAVTPAGHRRTHAVINQRRRAKLLLKGLGVEDA